MKRNWDKRQAPGLSRARRGLALVWAVLLAGCAAGPKWKPEAPSPAPTMWLLDVENQPVALLEVARPTRGDRVEVQAQGPQVEVSLRFAHGVRVTPLVKQVGGHKPVLLRCSASDTAPGACARLAQATLAGRYAEALLALGQVQEPERDDASLEALAPLSEEMLRAMATHPEGHRLLVALFASLTSGYVSEEERQWASALLAAEAQRKYPFPEAFATAASHAPLIPYEAMGFTKAGSPLTAVLREDGKLAVFLSTHIYHGKYLAEAATLSMRWR